MTNAQLADLCCRRHHSKRTERIIQQSLVNILVQIPNEQVRADVKLLFVRRCLINTHVRDKPEHLVNMVTFYIGYLQAHLVNSYWFSPKLNLVHDLTSVFSILLRQKFAKAITLVSH